VRQKMVCQPVLNCEVETRGRFTRRIRIPVGRAESVAKKKYTYRGGRLRPPWRGEKVGFQRVGVQRVGVQRVGVQLGRGLSKKVTVLDCDETVFFGARRARNPLAPPGAD
jgi:hypothetical protein